MTDKEKAAFEFAINRYQQHGGIINDVGLCMNKDSPIERRCRTIGLNKAISESTKLNDGQEDLYFGDSEDE